MADGGYIRTTTKAPRYSPAVMKQMEGAYRHGLRGLARGPGRIDLPDMPAGVDIPSVQMGWQPSMADVRGVMPGAPKVRDIRRTQFKEQALPGMPEMPKFSSMDFAPIEAQARAGFQQQTLPTIAERFTTMGAGARGTGAFARTVGAAGAGLEGSLAALKAKMLPEWEMKQAQYGLQRGALGMQRGKLGLEQELGKAGISQRDAQMQMQRDLGLGGLEMQRGRLGLEGMLGVGRMAGEKAKLGLQRAGLQLQQQQQMGQFGLQRAGLQQKQQQLRTQQLLGMLGFKPPQMYGQPQVTQHAWGSFAQ